MRDEEEEVEVEVEVCCDTLLEAIQNGGIQVVEVSPGDYREVIPDNNGETGVAINFCPFCGLPKRDDVSAVPAPD